MLFVLLFFLGARYFIYKTISKEAFVPSPAKNIEAPPTKEELFSREVWQGTLHQLMRQRNLTLKDAWNVLKPLSGAFRWDDTLTVLLVSRKEDRKELMLKIEHDTTQYRFYRLDVATKDWVNEEGCRWYSPCWHIPVEGWIVEKADSISKNQHRLAPESVVRAIAAGRVQSIQAQGQQHKVCIEHTLNIQACYIGVERLNSKLKPGVQLQKGELVGWLAMRNPKFNLELFHIDAKLDAGERVFIHRAEDFQRLRSFLLSYPELLKI